MSAKNNNKTSTASLGKKKTRRQEGQEEETMETSTTLDMCEATILGGLETSRWQNGVIKHSFQTSVVKRCCYFVQHHFRAWNSPEDTRS